jgi:phage/plasmid-like protein (TIGR03299 family)
MAHEIEMKNGQGQMFYVGDAPWHGLGQKLDNPPSIREAIVAAGLDWSVGVKKLVTVDTAQVVPAVATYRQSDGRILGVVGTGYKPLQNIEAFEFFNPFLEAGLATLETAGSLRDGQRIWVLAKINRDPLVIKGNDIVNKYVLLSNSHDGTMAVRVGFVPIRVVCQNTLSASISNNSSKLIRVRHSGKVVENLEKLGEIMNLANAEFEANAEQYRLLASKQINQADLKKYIKVVFNLQDKVLEDGEIQESKILAKVIPLFEVGRGNNLQGIQGTYWAAYNAVIEYMQYYKGKDSAIRMDSTWFGQGAVQNANALEVAISMAKAA